MRPVSFVRPLVVALALVTLADGSAAQDHAAHQAAAAPSAQLTAYAKAFAAIAQVRDQVSAELAQPRNKKDEAQTQLHEKLREQIAKILQENGFTEDQYNRMTYVVSTDPVQRKAFDKLMGIPEPAPPVAAAPMPSNPHVGHVLTAFNGTPMGAGLLPTALAEAKVVAQHAALAVRASSNLEGMKTHAGHLIHAVEPAEGSTGPGSGYGLKKAVTNIATHIELAAKAQGASQNVSTHAVHIAVSARNVAKRADEIVALSKQVQAATSAADAAALITRINALAEQLVAGVDANKDGKIDWQEGEGGLQHVEQHVNLMIRAEG